MRLEGQAKGWGPWELLMVLSRVRRVCHYQRRTMETAPLQLWWRRRGTQGLKFPAPATPGAFIVSSQDSGSSPAPPALQSQASGPPDPRS